jgi:hypothetical protein
VTISAQTDIVGKVPPYVIRIVVDYDIVTVPVPIAAVVNIIGRDREEKSANIESVRSTAPQTPYMLRPNPAVEVAVFPGMIQVVMRIGATGVVSHPVVIFSVNVRSFRVARLIVEFPVLILRRCRMGSGSVHWGRTVRRYVTIPNSVLATLGLPSSFMTVLLCEQRQRNE